MSSKDKLIFGSYEVEEIADGSKHVLGKGSNGLTYKARHKHLGRVAALKVIKEDLLVGNRERGSKDKFLAEAKAVASLNHPGIATIYDFGLENDIFYQATEYCEGGTLQEHIDESGAITWADLRPLVVQILAGLECAHRHGIIHRDIKPANLMLSQRQPLGQAKIIDFGCAQSETTGSTDISVTRRGSGEVHLGFTPATASPEQLLEEPTDERSDLFSLGVTIWWLLEGKNPFAGLKTALLYADRLGPASYEGRLPDDIDPEAREILVKLLEKKPENRIPSATAVLDLMGTLVAPATLELPPSTIGEDDSRLSGREEPVVALPTPSDFDDTYTPGTLFGSFSHAKLYRIDSGTGAGSLIAVIASPTMESRFRAGLRLAAMGRLEMGTFSFVDWCLSGSDDVFVISRKGGCSLLSVLRKVGSARFKDALPFFVQLARSFDTSVSWLGQGIQVEPENILVLHKDGGSDPDGFQQWSDVDVTSVNCLPLFEGGGENSSSSEETISTSTHGFPPLARFAALVYRVVSGSAVSHAAFYTDSGYVMASAFSEDGNALIADTLCNPAEKAGLGHFLQMLASLESQQVGEILPLVPPPHPSEIASASLPLELGNNRPVKPASSSAGASSVDDEIAEMKRQLEEKIRDVEERKAAEAKAARIAEEKRVAEEAAEMARIAEEKRIAEQERRAREAAEAKRKADEERLAMEAAEAERLAQQKRVTDEKAAQQKRLEDERLAKLADEKAAKAKADLQKRIQDQAKEAAARLEKERELELKQQRDKEEKDLQQAAKLEQKNLNDAARLSKAEEAKKEEARLQAELAAARQAADVKQDEIRVAAEEETKRNLATKEANAKEKAAADAAFVKAKQRELDQKAAAREKEKIAQLEAKKKAAADKATRVGTNQGPKKKILIACSVIALAAIASAFVFRGDDKPVPVVKNPPVENPDTLVVTPPKVPAPKPDPVVPKPPEKPTTITVRFTKPESKEEGFPYTSFELVNTSEPFDRHAYDGNPVPITAKPGTEYKLTLLGTIGEKDHVPLASRLITFSGEPSKTMLEVNLPANLPIIEISNPYDKADYSTVSVTPPTDMQPIPTAENLADLNTGTQTPVSIDIMKFTPEAALREPSGKSFPAKDKALSFPVAGKGLWVVTYSGSLLGDRTEKISVEGNNPSYPKTFPAPFSGSYSVVVPMTKFPSETARNKMGKDEVSEDGSTLKVPYFNEMTYVPDDKKHVIFRKNLEVLLGELALPHYIGIIANLDFRGNNLNPPDSTMKILRVYSHMEVFHSDCRLVGVDSPKEGSIRLDLVTTGGYQGGYSLPGSKEWAEEYLKLTKEVRIKEIHPFVEKSMNEWAGFFGRSENKGTVTSPSSMKFGEWEMKDFSDRFQVVLSFNESNIYLSEVTQVIEKSKLYYGHPENAELPDLILAVYYESKKADDESELNPIKGGEFGQ